MPTYDNIDRADRNAHVALGLLLGTIVGIGVGILVAPRSGQETRKIMRLRAVAAKQGARQQFARRREMAMAALTKSLDAAKQSVEKTSPQRIQGAAVRPRTESTPGTRTRRAAS